MTTRVTALRQLRGLDKLDRRRGLLSQERFRGPRGDEVDARDAG